MNSDDRPYCARHLIRATLLVAATMVCAHVYAAATFVVNVGDGPGEGFNDPSPPDPVSAASGNPGATLGAQRLWAFQKAGEFWGQRLDSTVPIVVDAEMNPLACGAFSAVLGSAGTTNAVANWRAGDLGPGGSLPPLSQTWYHIALANRIAANDLLPANADIGATFNSDIDNNNSCLQNTNWYYGITDVPPFTVSFFTTVLHELGHGLGVSTFVNTATGSKALGFDDIYMVFLEDHDSGVGWSDSGTNNAERASSAIDTGNLHWTGTNVRSESSVLTNGAVGDHVRMFAPNPLQGGSSVSHWDTVLANGTFQELMEPSATGSELIIVTDEMLQDEGWNAFEGDCAAASDDLVLSNQTINNTQSFTACLTIDAGTNFIIDSTANVDFEAGRGITLGPAFQVQGGATFTATVDPLMTLK